MKTIYENGKKYYRHFTPSEEGFQKLLKENLNKKYALLNNKPIQELNET